MSRFETHKASVGVLVLAVVFVALTAPPIDTVETKHTIIIPDGFTMAETALLLEKEGIVYSSTVVRIISFLRRADGLVKAGDYLFTEPIGPWDVVVRLMHGEYGLEPLRIRLPEGATRHQMADVLSEKLSRFDRDRFLELTHEKEGYLFPDTYFVLPTASAERVVALIEETFFERMHELEPQFVRSGRPLEEVVTMASLVEREAYIPADQKLIAGVLWNRIELGMALQVDAPFFFLLGKTSSELTVEDLQIESPYNTYITTGLPPTPIANPGLGAIEAALDPTPSEYLYYLSDEDGVTHFAETFDEHKENKILYLR